MWRGTRDERHRLGGVKQLLVPAADAEVGLDGRIAGIDPFNSDHMLSGKGATMYGTNNLRAWSGHREPTLQSDLRNGDCVPASTRLAGPSSPDLRASSEPGSAPPRRIPHPTAQAASTVRILSVPLHSRRATALANQAS